MRQVGFCRGGHWPPVFLCDQVLVIRLACGCLDMNGHGGVGRWVAAPTEVPNCEWGGTNDKGGRKNFKDGWIGLP